MPERVAELIRAFDVFDGSYKREEVDAALALQQEITPHLLEILHDVARDPAAYVEEDHFANTYAAILLGHFREPAAYLPLVRAFCIPEKEREEIWGDMVTVTLPALLYQTCNGSFDAVRELAGDREVSFYVRAAALDAIKYAVGFGVLPREEALEYFTGLFTGEEADRDSDFWSNLVTIICDIHPEGAVETIRRAYEDGLVSPAFVGLHEVEREMARDKGEVLAELRDHVQRCVPADIHEYCSWFSCFREGDDGLLSIPAPGAGKHGTKGGKKSPNRKKNKLARKSRKRNKR